MASTLLSQVDRVQRGITAIEFVYQSHRRWPLHPHAEDILAPDTPASNVSTAPESSRSQPLLISILDSSFNPPTLAHLALARSRPPSTNNDHAPVERDYDARLLLLSVRNADKSLKPGDATYVQRVDMMIELARILESESSDATIANVAVALIDEPTFVRKSTVLSRSITSKLTSLSSSSHPISPPRLTFLLGFDTLERLFASRYYPSPSSMLQSLRSFLSDPPYGEGSRVVCARRVTSDWLSARVSGAVRTEAEEEEEENRRKEAETMRAAEEFIRTDGVSFIDLTEDEQRMSSSEVRKRVAEGYEWEAMVPVCVAEYIKEENLYVI